MGNGFIKGDSIDDKTKFIPVDIEKVDSSARGIGTYLTVKKGKYVIANEYDDLIYGIMWHDNTICTIGVVGERKYL